MYIKIVDEWKDIEKDYGFMDTEKIKHLISEATRLDLDCLIGIDTQGDTYFNPKQCEQIKHEIAELRKKSNIDEQLLDWIDEAIDIVLPEGTLFLKFIGE